MSGEPLLLDQGNTRLKWRYAKAVRIGEITDLPSAPNAGDKAYWTSSRASGANSDLTQPLTTLGWQAHRVQAQQGLLGLQIGYTKPDTLGVDRWLAMLACWQRFGSDCVVVSAGSALTVDTINNMGQHLGGMIAPGLQYMRASLSTLSPRLDSDSALDYNALGRNTAQCVAAGCYSAVLGVIRAALQSMPNAHLVLGGGDAMALQAQLPWPKRWLCPDDLVLRGIALYAQNMTRRTMIGTSGEE